MGTTLVATVFCDDKVIVAHVGDSRLYRLRGEEFVAMTHDHSVLQEQIDSGLITAKEARYSLNRNLVTRAIGVDPDGGSGDSRLSGPGGRCLSAVFGWLYDMVDEAEIQQAWKCSAPILIFRRCN
jgi:serine/threonine protein phosphatase PrpC